MADWSKGVTKVNGLEVAYHRSASRGGRPTIVLLHGYTDNGLCWSRIAHDLDKQYDVIMLDARGHGQTVGPVEDMRIDLLAEDVAAVIREMRLDKPFVFGHSMGAMTALALAANHPDKVKAAVLEDPPFKAEYPFIPPPDEARLLEQDAQDALARQKLTFEERLARGRVENPGWSEEELIPWAQAHGEYNPAIVPHRIAFRSYNWREAMSKLQCPALLVVGDVEKGALVTPELAEESAQLCPTCEIAHIEGAGHCIHRDRYAESLQRVTEFLEAAGQKTNQ